MCDRRFVLFDFPNAQVSMKNSPIRFCRYGGHIYREAQVLYALTLKQPWLYCILYLNKRIENRKWYPPKYAIGERIYLHAGKSFDQEGYDYLISCGIELPDTFDTGAVLGSCQVSRVITRSNDFWFTGPYGWVLKDVEVLDEPIPLSGNQRLWKMPEDFQYTPTV